MTTLRDIIHDEIVSIFAAKPDGEDIDQKELEENIISNLKNYFERLLN